ncbi:mitochondrial aaa [Moniliophthora roreri]|nr:mitochondrial aaa [Moniliophthora roreri]
MIRISKIVSIEDGKSIEDIPFLEQVTRGDTMKFSGDVDTFLCKQELQKNGIDSGGSLFKLCVLPAGIDGFRINTESQSTCCERLDLILPKCGFARRIVLP